MNNIAKKITTHAHKQFKENSHKRAQLQPKEPRRCDVQHSIHDGELLVRHQELRHDKLDALGHFGHHHAKQAHGSQVDLAVRRHHCAKANGQYSRYFGPRVGHLAEQCERGHCRRRRDRLHHLDESYRQVYIPGVRVIIVK